ncbi:unnamed protein product [Schistosoma curassoni]|uniref:Coatomer subunit zeta n=1 Tax=Schistosoma curassoni TaxID=6186 RepID=A0A183KF34_9TREM|nr:unnamed protein product [Schistosoma curassoni]
MTHRFQPLSFNSNSSRNSSKKQAKLMAWVCDRFNCGSKPSPLQFFIVSGPFRFILIKIKVNKNDVSYINVCCSSNSLAEITLLDGATCVYRNVGDLYFYVVGDANENELLLVSALQCLYDSVSQALKRSVEKKTLMDNLDLIFLIVDELCHNGILLESDATALVSRVGARTDDIPLGEQTVAQVILAPFR